MRNLPALAARPFERRPQHGGGFGHVGHRASVYRIVRMTHSGVSWNVAEIARRVSVSVQRKSRLKASGGRSFSEWTKRSASSVVVRLTPIDFMPARRAA